jgi:16S rRNA (cytidine1402-2'-O)-methyltransferase
MLYLIATPIGNLSDITIRALELLKSCDYVLCEDTRHSRRLFDHYEIQTQLKSFHMFSEARHEDGVIEDLKNGKSIGLISDAGTPGISDPGSRLVKRCRNEGIAVYSIPGACAAIAGLTCSGLDTDRFEFRGFLPRKESELRTALQEILAYPGTTICYESPERLMDALEQIKVLAPERKIVVARELTKKFEEVISGTAQKLIAHFTENPLKGEIVLMIEGKTESVDWSTLTPEEHVAYLENTFSMDRKEAIKMAAAQRGIPKRTIYNKMMLKDNT